MSRKNCLNPDNQCPSRTAVQFMVVMLTSCASFYLADAPPDIEVGKKLYAVHCAECHGENGIGQDQENLWGGKDSQGDFIAPALNGKAHSWHHSPKYLFKYTKIGSPKKGSSMPGYGTELNNHEILSIIAYFQSLWPDKIKKLYIKKHSKELNEIGLSL